jgi:hypothetical protein
MDEGVATPGARFELGRGVATGTGAGVGESGVGGKSAGSKPTSAITVGPCMTSENAGLRNMLGGEPGSPG